MNTESELKFCQHAAREYPKEACGLLIVRKGRERYVPCNNIAEDPTRTFVIDPDDYAAAEDEGEVIGVCHSHPDGKAELSEADRVNCAASYLPWYVVAINARFEKTDVVRFEPAEYVAPLVGREFSHGVLDCYSLIRDYYLRELNILLPDFPRQDDWWNKGEDLYMEHFREAGFELIKGAIQKHDVILMQVRSPKVNHGAVFLGEPDHMLHHMYGRLSTREVYGGWYQEITRVVIRHRELSA